MKSLISFIFSICTLSFIIISGLYYCSNAIQKNIFWLYQRKYFPFIPRLTHQSTTFSLRAPIQFNKITLKHPLYSIVLPKISSPLKLSNILKSPPPQETKYQIKTSQIDFFLDSLFTPHTPSSSPPPHTQKKMSWILPLIQKLTYFSPIATFDIQNLSTSIRWNESQHFLDQLEGEAQFDTQKNRINIDLSNPSERTPCSISFSTSIIPSKNNYYTFLYQSDKTPHSLFIRYLQSKDLPHSLTLHTNTGLSYNRLHSYCTYSAQYFFYNSSFYQNKISFSNWFNLELWIQTLNLTSFTDMKGKLFGVYLFKKPPYQNIPIFSKMTTKQMNWHGFKLQDCHIEHLTFWKSSTLCSAYKAKWKEIPIHGFFKTNFQKTTHYFAFEKKDFKFSSSWLLFDLLSLLTPYTSSTLIRNKTKVIISKNEKNIFYKGYCEIETFLKFPPQTPTLIKKIFHKKTLHLTAFYAISNQTLLIKSFILRIDQNYYVGKGSLSPKGNFIFHIALYKKPSNKFSIQGHISKKEIEITSKGNFHKIK